MTRDTIVHFGVEALAVSAKLALPFLLAGLVVGLVVSIFQAATQIQEATLSFIPKIVVTGVVLAVAGPWMLDVVVGYTQELFRSIPTYVGP